MFRCRVLLLLHRVPSTPVLVLAGVECSMLHVWVQVELVQVCILRIQIRVTTSETFRTHTRFMTNIGQEPSTTKQTMKERSSTISVNGYANRPIDRVLGAAATLGIGLFLFQTFCRYLRRMKDDESKSWMAELTKLLRTSVKEVRSSSEGEAWHAGACHCRSVLFEVSACTIVSFNVGFGAWLHLLSNTSTPVLP
jgi:hypothetical protein